MMWCVVIRLYSLLSIIVKAFHVFIWQAKMNEQREHAKRVAEFNLEMSERKEKAYCPLYPVSTTGTLRG